MYKLSSRAWNNVIIFAMLFMVYLFSISNKFIVENENSDNVGFLLPEHSVIMQIHFAELTLERIGKTWRSKGSDQWTMDALNKLIHTWGKLVVYKVPFMDIDNPYVVSMLIAGEEKQRVFLLLERADGVLINQQGVSYFVPGAKLKNLVPD